VGRRTAYLGRFTDAIAIFSSGLAKYRGDARLYRHRGHRYLTIRHFDRAIGDLLYAVQLTRGKPDQVEPDGQPNAKNIPTSTLQSNIWYHLGWRTIEGDFRHAVAAPECLGCRRTTTCKSPPVTGCTWRCAGWGEPRSGECFPVRRDERYREPGLPPPAALPGAALQRDSRCQR
jgi:hypothetical protein